MSIVTEAVVDHPVVTREEWLASRVALLELEKQHTRAADELARKRLALPWVKIEKKYEFDAPEGKVTLADLFDGRSQLIVQHFMFGPGWPEGCVGCSFGADHVDGPRTHLEHHDVSFAAIARATIAKIEAYKRRMGWKFRFVSSFGSDFNYDFNVSFRPEDIASGTAIYNYRPLAMPMEDLAGASAFYKDEQGNIFHTYSTFARGGEHLGSTFALLDIAPKGRNETGPQHNLVDWVRHHDRY